MRLTGKRIAILVAEDVEDLEFYVPFMRLQEEGAEVIGAGLDLKSVHGKNGLEITPNAKIDSLKSKDLFALVIPGGWAPDKLRRHSVVTNLVREMNDAKKPIGIICHGGLVAISAELDALFQQPIRDLERQVNAQGPNTDLRSLGLTQRLSSQVC